MARRFGARDLEYIENRLLAPCVPAEDAYTRISETIDGALAEKLMKAMQDFTDKCRAIRLEVVDRYREDADARLLNPVTRVHELDDALEQEGGEDEKIEA